MLIVSAHGGLVALHLAAVRVNRHGRGGGVVYGVAVAGLAKIFGGYNPVFKDVVPKGIFVSRGLGGAHRAGGVFFRVIKVTFAAANDFHNNEPPVCKWC